MPPFSDTDIYIVTIRKVGEPVSRSMHISTAFLKDEPWHNRRVKMRWRTEEIVTEFIGREEHGDQA